MNYDISDLPVTRGALRVKKNLGKMCWFGVGGEVDFFFSPADIDDLQHFLKNKPQDLPVFIFGVGSNLLVRDGGFRGVAIRLGAGFNFVNQMANSQVHAGCSSLDLNVAMYCAHNGIGGLEFLSGIPGTLGGAIAMNAGAYGKEIKDVLISAKAITMAGDLLEIKNEDFCFHYRGHGLKGDNIFLECLLQGHEDDEKIIHEKILDIQDARAASQPIKSKTGGSTFTNPPGYKAWELIDKAGCRGLKIGGAKVSEMHCNFLINEGGATAKDLEDLIVEVQKRVLQTSGVELATEIKIIGSS